MLLPANRVVGENGIFECFGHIGLAWIWLDTVTAAAGCRGDFYDGTRQVACYFVIYELREVAA